ncbi:hypothetical protein BGW38_007032 [Lunasporangiospora selenospora]|uniref:Uncharacterized protein n=1 Tax=Lunasporangiospora selenospora TaxID=979761 RepID=A0A9P6FM77_9FUNG|nr:hypothetical protein BGW38_007032 [Lunasporangiospora selenospora]
MDPSRLATAADFVRFSASLHSFFSRANESTNTASHGDRTADGSHSTGYLDGSSLGEERESARYLKQTFSLNPGAARASMSPLGTSLGQRQVAGQQQESLHQTAQPNDATDSQDTSWEALIAYYNSRTSTSQHRTSTLQPAISRLQQNFEDISGELQASRWAFHPAPQSQMETVADDDTSDLLTAFTATRLQGESHKAMVTTDLVEKSNNGIGDGSVLQYETRFMMQFSSHSTPPADIQRIQEIIAKGSGSKQA